MLLPSPRPPLKPLRGWFRGGWRGLAPATWVEKRGGWRRERGRRDACSRFPYRRGTVVCAFMKICQTLPPSLFLALSLSLSTSLPLSLSLSLGCSAAGVADLGVMTYRVSSARRSQTPFLQPPPPSSFTYLAAKFFLLYFAAHPRVSVCALQTGLGMPRTFFFFKPVFFYVWIFSSILRDIRDVINSSIRI